MKNLSPKESFFTFMKNISSIGNQMELYSSLNKEYINSISNNEITNLYEEEFNKNKITLKQLSEYLDLIYQNKIAFDNNSLRNIKTMCRFIYIKKNLAYVWQLRI